MGVRKGALAETLTLFREGLLARMGREDAALLRAAGDRPLGCTPLAPGDQAPPLVLHNQHDRLVSLADRLRLGPVVLLFVRGGWCPFCSATLRSYQDAVGRLQEAGGDLLAISPEPVANNAVTAERDLLSFPLLSDSDHAAMRAFGIAYTLPEALRPVYRRLGHDLGLRDPGGWELPMPATFVIGPDGQVLLSYVQSAEYKRLDPSDAVQAVTRAAMVRDFVEAGRAG